MRSKIFGTLGSKVLISLGNFLLLILTTQYLGADGRGYISLLITNLALIQLINQVLSGPAMVYLMPRKPIEELVLPAYLWAIISAPIACILLQALGQIPLDWLNHHILLSILYSVFSMHLMLLLGKEKIGAYNFLQFWEVLSILAFVAFFFLGKEANLEIYLWALYASYISGLLLSVYFVRNILRFSINLKLLKNLKEMLQYGFVAQVSNVLTFLNYRLAYYMLYFFLDIEDLGKYSAGIALAEGIWIVSKSFALVQYSRLVNEEKEENRLSLSNSTIVLVFWLTLFALIIALAIPKSIYIFILGAEFGQAKDVITFISPGILFLAISSPISSYFSSSGRFSINNKAAFFGLLINIVAGLLLIPSLGMIGACISTSVVYAAILAYQTFQYSKNESLSAIKWLKPIQALNTLK